ncbi:LOW QUALITY PROTEIN: tensin-2 [Oenanthe melanoleuca]|uniref:LOW QUALITY PROTEIN: tensin-2 n=1 Tax=Oenanthe melanoleuca TaxID=2939378 RepID=UPI0024C119E5|nr:LOW QUALITY PROTEIN: tensin-2 [Oenanthe melanoleuca]
MKPPGAVGTLLRAFGRRDVPDTPRPPPPAPHTFRERSLRRGAPCGGCGTPLGPHGLVCRVCKVAAHKRCESKVTSPCQPLPPPELRRNTAPVRRSERVSSSLDSAPQRSTLPRTPRAPSPETSPFPPLDLTFVTERILSVGVPGGGEGGPGGHLRHLAKLLGARHGPNYTIFNLSEKRRDLTRLNPKVLDFGWPELLAPPLELLCSVCKALEGCLGGHPRNVAVLLSKGSKAPVGVVVGAFLHYSDVWGSPEQALNALSMRRFCEEKLGGVLQPSQRRYTEDFGALLSGRLRLNSSPQFLHHVLLPPLPAYDPPDGCRPFLKIYQSLRLVYTSGVYSPPASQSLCVTLEPALLLKGDVMVRCYHRRRGGREAVFGVQFHTGTLRGPRLRLRRDELDLAWQDQRFPPDATVEFIFSSGPERVEGWVPPRGPPAAPIDYGVRDPAVRRDSYEGRWESPEEPSHTWGPLDGSPYARVQKKGGPCPPGPDSDSPPPPGAPQGRPPGPTAAERRELEQLLGGFGVRGGRETPGPGEETPDTPEPLGTPAAYGSPEPLGTPAPYRSPTSYGTPISHGTPTFHETPISHETPPAHGMPISYGTPISHKTPPSHGTPTFHGTPAPHSPLTSCGTLTPHGLPTSYGAPKSQGSPTPYDTPKPYGTLVPHVTLTLHGPPASQGSPTSYGTPAPHGPPSIPRDPNFPRGHSALWNPNIPQDPNIPGVPDVPRDPDIPGHPPSLASPRDPPKRGVQRSLSEGFPPWGGYGRPVAGGTARAGGASPRSPPAQFIAAMTGGRPRWSPQIAPIAAAPGWGWSGDPPPRKGGYDPPAVEEPQEPAGEGGGQGRRSPIEGTPWPGPPRAPSPSSGTPGSPPPPQPPLPEKRHPPAPGGPRDPSSPQRSPGGAQGHPSAGPGPGGTPPGGTFVQDTTKFWYKPGLSREEAVSLLKAAPPGSFLVRRSSSFPGAFGLALRVGVPPPRATPRTGDPQEQLVRHFLIETGPRGVKIRGCPEEPYFGSLPALVLQHSITPISLPCALRIPHAELQEEPPDPPGPPNVSTAGALLRQGAACSVLFLGSVGTEALTGPQAVAKAVGSLLEGTPSRGGPPGPPPSPVHFKVSAQGITLTDRQRKLFFRRHYPVSSVTHCGTDPQDRRWANPDGSTARIFGFVAKQAGAPGGGNACHVFAELDPEQPAGAIVTFVTKVLLGTRH